ncbi:hypothetical protein BDV34DRAFT_222293 [Aspergillus parasiticus]|uniref:C2H2-type domain-containing protein n=1 Tax=Aspergillus parasiticus TaxID=5067 RepID=A0A5N6DU12_ASPPA|nr:hypothetical protein BDV34DRAFT_222293 [Aspergillus parasiticus]
MGGPVWGTSEFSFTEDQQDEPSFPNEGQGYIDPYHLYAPITAASYPSNSSSGVVPADPTVSDLSPTFFPWPIDGNTPTHMPVHDNNVDPEAPAAIYISSLDHPQEHPCVPSPDIQHPSQSSTITTTLTTNQNVNTKPRTTKTQTNDSTKPKQWRCDRKDCKYKGTFARKAELKRHIESLHVAPGSHECPFCGRQHNRKDNLASHLKTVH